MYLLRGRCLPHGPCDLATAFAADPQEQVPALRAAYRGVLFVGLSKLRDKRGPQGLSLEDKGDEMMAGVAAIEASTGRVLGILEFITGVDEIFDVQVLPDIRRSEILAPYQGFEQPSIVTIKRRHVGNSAHWKRSGPISSG